MTVSNLLKLGCLITMIVSAVYALLLAYIGSWMLSVLWLVIAAAGLLNYTTMRDAIRKQVETDKSGEKLNGNSN